jgi:hypothetical protein
MLAHVGELEDGLAKLGLLPSTIGHNRPMIADSQGSRRLGVAIATLKAQSPNPAVRPAQGTEFGGNFLS